MEFVKVLALRGPNIWAYFPVIEAWVDLCDLNDTSSDSVPGLNDRLMSWLPGMIEHRCSIGERGGFFERLRRGTYPAHILEHVTIELQTLAGSPVGYGRARASAIDGVYKVVFQYKDETLARACLHAARDLVMAAIHDRPFDLPSTVSRLRTIAHQSLLNPSADAIVQAARARNIPFLRLNSDNLVQLGTGSRQRRIRAAETDQSGSIAGSIAQDRELTRTLLQAAGVPTVEGYPVASETEAWETAEYLGLPVIVKPRFGRRGVTRLDTPELVVAAYQAAAREGPSVLVEKFVPGIDYRLLVVGGKLAAAAQRTGGKSNDVTDLVHPETAEWAVLAARIVGLDIAGVDITANDIAAPLAPQGGGIVEVNASPGLGPHLAPDSGQPRPVGAAIVDMLFAPGDDGRIPVAAVTGANGKTTVARFLAHLLQQPGRSVGLTCSDGVYLNEHRIVAGDSSGPTHSRNLLMHPDVDIAVLETPRGGILSSGLAFNECRVAVVTNVGEGDSIGHSDINTPEDLATVKCGVVELVSRQGAAVLNAADPLVAAMAGRCPGPVIFFAADAANAIIAEHRAAGARSVFVRNGQLVLATGTHEDALLPIGDVPVTHGGRITFEVENTLAAAAAAWAMDVPRDTIAERLRSLASSFIIAEYRAATVIVDFGHNVHALRALIEALQSFPHTRRVAVFSSASDRRDADIVLIGELLGSAFDRVILYENGGIYDRKPGELTALLRQGLAAAVRTKEIETAEDGLAALEYALSTIQPGDLLVAQSYPSGPVTAFLGRLPPTPDSTIGS